MVSVSNTMNRVDAWKLCAERVGIRRGRQAIVTDFSWEHHPGEIAWLVGDNGAGKSSLLRVLAGRGRPASGSVHYDGPVGVEPRLLYYHPDMRLPTPATVGDWRRLLGEILPAADAYPLDPALLPAGAAPHKQIDRLSTGEAKRLVLAALLRRDAPLLFLDEPYEHLSGEGKDLLTEHLMLRARHRVVVVATNQEIPRGARGPVLRLDEDRVALPLALEIPS